MNNPEMAEVWQTAFSKDFSDMVQGDNKIGQEGINSVFVKKWDELINSGRTNIDLGTNCGRLLPPKEDPNQIQVVVGGNLMKHMGDMPTRIMGLTMSKLL